MIEEYLGRGRVWLRTKSLRGWTSRAEGSNSGFDP
jgi:hypothetical protein